MQILPHANTVIAAVDHLHRGMRYDGGRLPLSRLFDTFPGFLIAPAAPGELPSGTAAVMARAGGCVRIAFNADEPKPRRACVPA